MKISIAQSYINLGKQKEGDALFEKYLMENPKWGWGWIGWSDCYWIFYGSKQNDFEKAETILKKALTVPELHDREHVMERLVNLYNDVDRKDEAAAIKREYSIQSSSRVKVGRNDPCPCGSGKKYKKCCGK